MEVGQAPQLGPLAVAVFKTVVPTGQVVYQAVAVGAAGDQAAWELHDRLAVVHLGLLHQAVFLSAA